MRGKKMATNFSWKSHQPKQLKKIAYAMTEAKLQVVIDAHEDRGWVQASHVKKHGYGFGCLLVWGQKSPLEV